MDESTWTLEDQRIIRIQLIKAHYRTKNHCWLSLFKGRYQPDPLTLNEMRKKLDLEQFQTEVGKKFGCTHVRFGFIKQLFSRQLVPFVLFLYCSTMYFKYFFCRILVSISATPN